MFKIDEVPLDDKPTWDLIQSGNTLGVFQYDSYLGQHWCKTIKPENIEELAAIGALIRPGCLHKSGSPPKSMTQRYADRKHGLEPVESYHPALDSILKPTYNCLVFQEQAMAIAQKIAGFDLNDADQLRKAIGKKSTELMAKTEKIFIEGCEKTGIVNEKQAKEIFSWIKASQRYSFNKSHAVAYAINGYKCSYAKANYILEFYTAYLQGCKWKQKKMESVKELVIDGRSNNIDFVPPSIIDLKIEPYIKNEKYVAFGISSIRDIGDSARQKLFDYVRAAEDESGKKLSDWKWIDLLLLLGHRIQKRNKIGSKTLEALIFSGALDCLGETRHKMQFEYEIYKDISMGVQKFLLTRHISFPFNSLEDALKVAYPTKKEGGGCHSQKISDKVHGIYLGIQSPAISLMDDVRFIALSEEKYLGIAISCSQADDTIQSDISNYTCKALANGIGMKNITVVAEISRFNIVKTKNGENPGKEMAFIDLYDKTGGIHGCVAFPGAWEKMSDIINLTDSFYILCSRTKNNSLSLEKIEKIT
jgi:DNA polymerase III alpha subunit